MAKRVVAMVMATIMLMGVIGCGKTEPIPENAETAQENETTEEARTELDALGDIETDENLFSVEITVPKDFIGDDVTQESLDVKAKEEGYKSATLNEDGSVTYVMTKKQHKEMLDGIKESLDNSLDEIVESDEYPSIVGIETNDNYTEYKISCTSEELNLTESFVVMALYMYSGIYGVFSGEEIDNVHVVFVNADTGEIIEETNSADMEDE